MSISKFILSAQASIGAAQVNITRAVVLSDGTVVADPSDVHLYNQARDIKNRLLAERAQLLEELNTVPPSERARVQAEINRIDETLNAALPPEPPATPAGPEAFSHISEGHRGQLLTSFMGMEDDHFESMVSRGSFGEEWKDSLGRPITSANLENGFVAHRQTRYFNVEAVPGDGIIVADFWIAEDSSGGFLAGDGRGYVDPMNADLGLNDSRMTVMIDRETGRGMITVSPTTVRVVDVPGSLDSLINDPIFTSGTQYNDLITVPARPIVFGPNPGLTSGIHDNYFEINADGNSISIDYDSVNSVTAAAHMISVDGPIVIEHGTDGLFTTSSSNDPDAYPSIAVVQYLPDGTSNVVFSQENEPVIPGAIGD